MGCSMHCVADSDSFTSFNDIFILHKRDFCPIWLSIRCVTIVIDVWIRVNVCLFVSQAMVSCQMLSELEEVIQYKLVPERRDIIRETWWERLQVTTVHDRWMHTHMHTHSRVQLQM